MKYLIPGLLLFIFVGCSDEKSSQINILLETKTPDEIYVLSGKRKIKLMLHYCKNIESIECISHIKTTVTELNNNGYGEVKVEDFSKTTLSRFLAKIDASELMKGHIARTPIDSYK